MILRVTGSSHSQVPHNAKQSFVHGLGKSCGAGYAIVQGSNTFYVCANTVHTTAPGSNHTSLLQLMPNMQQIDSMIQIQIQT
jgi:hypothetical protein